MSSSPAVPPPAPRKPWFGLSKRALLLIALAFGAGLLLFLLLMAGNREEDGFFRAGDATRTDRDTTVFEPLPTPDAAGGDQRAPASGAGDDIDAHTAPARDGSSGVIEDPGSAFPPPLPQAEPEPVYEPAPPPAPVARADTSAKPVRAPAPRYPGGALRRGESGEVLLQVQVDAQGRPSRVEVVQSSRSRLLDREAVRAVQRWEFSPAIRGGQPVSATVLVPIQFDR
jgi:protein TonB